MKRVLWSLLLLGTLAQAQSSPAIAKKRKTMAAKNAKKAKPKFTRKEEPDDVIEGNPFLTGIYGNYIRNFSRDANGFGGGAYFMYIPDPHLMIGLGVEANYFSSIDGSDAAPAALLGAVDYSRSNYHIAPMVKAILVLDEFGLDISGGVLFDKTSVSSTVGGAAANAYLGADGKSYLASGSRSQTAGVFQVAPFFAVELIDQLWLTGHFGYQGILASSVKKGEGSELLTPKAISSWQHAFKAGIGLSLGL
jgi:hypothetical protein